MVLGVKRLGCGGELTKGKNRGEATWGEMVLGRKRERTELYWIQHSLMRHINKMLLIFSRQV